MNFGITFNKNYNYNSQNSNLSGLDYAAIKEIKNEIFERANNANALFINDNLSKFSRTDNGLDFYNGQLDSELSKNLSLQNSGNDVDLNRTTLDKIQYLNSQAAMAAGEAKMKHQEGKVQITPIEYIANTKGLNQQNIELNFNEITVSHSNGANPFGSFTGGSDSNADKNHG